MKRYYIGLMSGTSLDGVDVALCEIDHERCHLVSAMAYPFDDDLKADILRMIDGETTLLEVGEVDHRLGTLFAEAVEALMVKVGLDPAEIEAIGSHGQTLWHDPDGRYPFSMQLGDPNIITTKTGIKCVADFRRKDLALGGQGAPFAPAFHESLFKRLSQKVAVVNIGGMANITLLGEQVIGYDTGPGNVLMDLWTQKCQGTPYDRDGLWARSGEVDTELLKELLEEPFFTRTPPKSTGRELFNRAWLSDMLNRHESVSPEDVQATLLALTVSTIASEARSAGCELLLVCGGGAKNRFLMERLSEMMDSVEVASTDAYGVDSDLLEAMAFAWFAYKRIHHEHVELSSVTGAKSDGVLGGVYE